MAYTFVLVHGSWHDNRPWQPVIDRLEQNGHKVYAPTVAGHAPNDRKDVTHADCVRSVVDFIKASDVRDFILVGHSFGGTLIQPVAEQVADRVRRLVFWNAFVLLDGQSLEDNIPPHYKELFDAIAQPDGGVMLPYPIWRDAFINDADDALARKAYGMLSPTPKRSHSDKVPLKTFYSLQIPKSYLNCTEDTALPPGEWGWHPRMSSRLGLYRLVQMPGSHEAIFTNPQLLADKFVEAGRD